MEETRCHWAKNPIDIEYHDNEWGNPVHNDRVLFEFLILEGMQAGLSWTTILKKRENIRRAFDELNPSIIIEYGIDKIEELMLDAGIIRNRAKINSVVKNAKAFLDVQKEYDTFDNYIWSFVGGDPTINVWDEISQVPASTEISDKMSKDLKKRGFSFVGSTICYAFMQAVGMVNDHMTWCYKYKKV